MRAIAWVVLLTMLYSGAPTPGQEMSLSSALDMLRLNLQQAREQAQLSNELSTRQMQELGRLNSEVQTLNADLLASRISREQALQQARALLEQLTALRSELASSRKLSSEQAMEISALRLDRDRWKGKAELGIKLLRWGPAVAVVIGGLGFLAGRALR